MTEQSKPSTQASTTIGPESSSQRGNRIQRVGQAVSKLSRASTTESTPVLAENCCVLTGYRATYTPPEQPERVRGQIDPALRATIQELADGSVRWPLLLLGEAGSGKTCAALCMIDLFGGWYVTLPELCALVIRAQQGELSWSSGYRRFESDIWSAWRRARLVVVDEIGARTTVSDHHCETIKHALDIRQGKPAVFISNHLLVADLAKLYDDPISSRLASGTQVWLTGDRRVNRES